MNRYAICIILLTAATAASSLQAEPTSSSSQAYRGPTAAIASKDGKQLFVADADAGQLAIVDLARGVCGRTIAMPARPTGLVLSPDGATLYVTCAAPHSTVQFIDVATGQARGSVQVGHTAVGPAISNDGTRMYVCNRFDNTVSVIDVAERREITRVPAVREPMAAAITPDNRTLFVANHLPADAADADIVSAMVTIIDTHTLKATNIRLPNGSVDVRGICMSGDGKHVYLTHTVGRFNLPTVQVERGWINSNALSVLNATTKTYVTTVLLDEVDRGAANPCGVATTPDGRLICVAHAGTNELSVIDASSMLAKIASRSQRSAGDDPAQVSDVNSQIAIPSDLTFLSGIRTRVALKGVGPRGVTIIGSRAYVCEYFSDTLAVVALDASPAKCVARIALGPAPKLTQQRRGEILFNSGELCLQGWQSCASCHPEARADGLNWDLINDGLGNPKNAKSMLFAHRTPPSMASGIRPNAKVAVRSGIQHIQFTARPEADADAIDAYLEALQPVPSPHLADEHLSESAKRGQKLFFDRKVGCAECHPTPMYTDLKTYDVGSGNKFDRDAKFDNPTLIECWRTAPYMHDGHFVTIRELLEKGRHGETKDNFITLTPEQMADLVEFVLSL